MWSSLWAKLIVLLFDLMIGFINLSIFSHPLYGQQQVSLKCWLLCATGSVCPVYAPLFLIWFLLLILLPLLNCSVCLDLIFDFCSIACIVLSYVCPGCAALWSLCQTCFTLFCSAGMCNTCLVWSV